MGISKTGLFTEKQNELANIAKAIGHPARIAILQHLLKIEGCICNDLVQELGLAQPTISQHLKELKQVGLVQGTIEGASICYCIEPQAWNKYRALFAAFFEDLKPGNASCGPGCC
jgi:predicted transcriptional regulator